MTDGDGRVDVLAVGETMVLAAGPPGSGIDRTTSFRLRPAGAESNVAVHLARLGHRSEWAGLLGDDPFGQLVLDHLAKAGVGTSRAALVPGAPTGVFFKHARGTVTEVHYYRRGSAASTTGPDDVVRLAGLRPRVLHLTGVTPALSGGCRQLVHRLVVDRAVPTELVTFDVNFRPGLWSAAEAGPVLRSLADAADVVFLGLDEAAVLWGAADAGAVRGLLPGPRVVVVKDGARGATSLGDGAPVFVAAPVVDVVEPVGAGDAFAAGWIGGWLRGDDDAARLRLGHAVAGAVLGTVFDDVELPAELVAP